MPLLIEAPPSRRDHAPAACEDCRVSLSASGPGGARVLAAAQVPVDFLHLQPRRARLVLTCDLERSLAGIARRTWGEGRLVKDECGEYRWEPAIAAAPEAA
jgi:hypothetical protein